VADQSAIIPSLSGWRIRGILAKNVGNYQGKKEFKKNLS